MAKVSICLCFLIFLSIAMKIPLWLEKIELKVAKVSFGSFWCFFLLFVEQYCIPSKVLCNKKSFKLFCKQFYCKIIISVIVYNFITVGKIKKKNFCIHNSILAIWHNVLPAFPLLEIKAIYNIYSCFFCHFKNHLIKMKMFFNNLKLFILYFCKEKFLQN